MAAKPKFPPRMPLTAQEERKILSLVAVSPVVQEILDRDAEEQLGRRRELITRLEAEFAATKAHTATITRRRQEAQKRREETEAAFRAAVIAEASLPLYNEPARAPIYALERELEETAPPEIAEFQLWVESEFDFTRLLTPAIEILPNHQYGGGNLGYDQTERAEIARRMDALRDAIPDIRALKLQALTHDEVLTALHAIHATIPTLTGGDARRRPLPKFMEAAQ